MWQNFFVNFSYHVWRDTFFFFFIYWKNLAKDFLKVSTIDSLVFFSKHSPTTFSHKAWVITVNRLFRYFLYWFYIFNLHNLIIQRLILKRISPYFSLIHCGIKSIAHSVTAYQLFMKMVGSLFDMFTAAMFIIFFWRYS